MKNKMMFLVLGLLALASATLPAVASAGEPVIDAKAFPVKFAIKGGQLNCVTPVSRNLHVPQAPGPAHTPAAPQGPSA